ncbi:MAG: YkvA family protein [Noviherbaspirillum sp.]
MTVAERVHAWARRIKRDGVTLWFACKHPGTPLAAKALALVVVAYALSPIDLIPDFIPVLGFLDDAILLPGLIWLAIRLMPSGVLAECRAQAAEWLEREGKPRTRWGIVFVAGIWGLAAYAVWRVLQP